MDLFTKYILKENEEYNKLNESIWDIVTLGMMGGQVINAKYQSKLFDRWYDINKPKAKQILKYMISKHKDDIATEASYRDFERQYSSTSTFGLSSLLKNVDKLTIRPINGYLIVFRFTNKRIHLVGYLNKPTKVINCNIVWFKEWKIKYTEYFKKDNI